MRTNHGLKCDIIRVVLSLKFEEFIEYIQIYEANDLKEDKSFLINLYNHIQQKLVWPMNIYIKLEDFYKLLQGECHCLRNEWNTNGYDVRTLLKYITPKFLHWQDLIQHTNFTESLKYDYYRRKRLELDLSDEVRVCSCSMDYYRRCWKLDQWLWKVPVINTELPLQFLDGMGKGEVRRVHAFLLYNHIRVLPALIRHETRSERNVRRH